MSLDVLSPDGISIIIASFCALVALCSLVISIWAVISSSKANDRSNILQERLVMLEEEKEAFVKVDRLKARLVSRVYDIKIIDKRTEESKARTAFQMGKPNEIWIEYVFSILNRGKCSARNVQAFINDIPQFGSTDVEILDPESEIYLNLKASYFGGRTLAVKLQWDDDFGVNRAHNSTLFL